MIINMTYQVLFNKELLDGRRSTVNDLSQRVPNQHVMCLATVGGGDYLRKYADRQFVFNLFGLMLYFRDEVKQLFNNRNSETDITDLFIISQVLSNKLLIYPTPPQDLITPLNTRLTDTGRTFFYFAGSLQRFICDIEWPVDENNSHWNRPDAYYTMGTNLDSLVEKYPENDQVLMAQEEFDKGRFPDKYPDFADEVYKPMRLGYFVFHPEG